MGTSPPSRTNPASWLGLLLIGADVLPIGAGGPIHPDLCVTVPLSDRDGYHRRFYLP